MYGNGQLGNTRDERMALMQPFFEDRHFLIRRITAAYNAVRNDERTKGTRIVVMGYCFGGICALDLARSGADLAGAVTFHGGLIPTGFPNREISAEVLVFHADNDKFVSQEDFLAFRDEMNTAGVRWQAHIYGGGVLHSFTNPDETDRSTGMAYDDTAASNSWQGLVSFLERTLR
jgi:dienelactone hydrolase